MRIPSPAASTDSGDLARLARQDPDRACLVRALADALETGEHPVADAG
jgi:hypothetical protein